MNITTDNVDTAERLSDLAMKIVIFLFVLFGVSVMTAFFIYCVMHDKSKRAQAISGFGDIVFFGAFGYMVRYFFVKKTSPAPRVHTGVVQTIHATAPAPLLEKKSKSKAGLSDSSDTL